MNRNVNAISGRLSLRQPQRDSLEILARVVELIELDKGADLSASLEVIRSEFPNVTDFERDSPSVCFALATGVGKTRLMGAFIAYLHLAAGVRHFFVMAPNLTIYNKLIRDFTPNTPKYVLQGISVSNGNQPLSSPLPASAPAVQPIFTTPAEQQIARKTVEVIKKFESLPRAAELIRPEIQAEIVRTVKEKLGPMQMALGAEATAESETEVFLEASNVEEVVRKATEFFIERGSIDVPRIICWLITTISVMTSRPICSTNYRGRLLNGCGRI